MTVEQGKLLDTPVPVPSQDEVLRGLGCTKQSADPPAHDGVRGDADGKAKSNERVHPGSWITGGDTPNQLEKCGTHRCVYEEHTTKKPA